MGHADVMESVRADDRFVADVQQALASLYNPVKLRGSPLLAILAPERRVNPLGALRQLLTDAIRALKPGADVPLHTESWRIHQVLTYRFMEQAPQKQVAADLGLSVRQLRRAESDAVRALADYLWARHGLAHQVRPSPDSEVVTPARDASDRADELAWLKSSLPGELCDVVEVTRSALKTVEPLLQAAAVRVTLQVEDEMPLVAGQRAILRQAVLNLLTGAAQAAPGGQVVIAMQHLPEVAKVCVRTATDCHLAPPECAEIREKIEVTRQLVALFGGELTVTAAAGKALLATVTLAAAEQVPVLAIDDNADALKLLEGYLRRSRYRLWGVRDPGEAVRLAESLRPRLILLDIMLPGIDGWELLGRLREHPQLDGVPVIVCTFLPQEELALTLGAATFLRKPISREALLSALDRQLGLPETGSH